MTKKAKRTALLQRTEEIAELRKENEQLKARLAEREKAEELLWASEEKFRALAEQSIQGIVIAQSVPPRFVYCNRALADMTGYTVDEFVSMTAEQVVNFIHADDQAVFFKRFIDLLDGLPSEGHYEFRALHRDGSVLWLESFSSVIQHQGQPAVQSSLVDITARKKAEELLRASEEKYRLLTERINDVIWTADLNLRITYVSPSAERVFGITPEARLRGELMLALTPESAASAQRLFLEQSELERENKTDPQGSVQIEAEYYRKDGSTGWVESVVSGIRDAKGSLTGIQGISRDITKRKLAEEALRESEERFRTLIEKATDVVVVLDANGRTSYQSPSLQRITGYEPHEWVDKSLTDFFLHPDDLAPLAAALERVLAQPGAALEDIHARYRHKDGSWHFLDGTVTNMLHDPKVNGLVANFRDVTERRKAEQALRDSDLKYRNLFENTLMGTEVIDAETGRIVLANRSIARMFGFKSPEDMIGIDAVSGWVLPEDMERTTQEIARSIADPERREVVTLRARGPDGKVRWVSGMGALLEYNGKPALLISLIDVSAAKEAEMKLQESEEKNRLLVENATEGIAVVQDGILKFANRKFAQSVGYSAQELVNRSFMDFIHPDDRQKVAEYYFKRTSGQEAPSSYQFKWIDRGGSVHWGEASVASLGWEGRPATLCMLSDITERKQGEQALRDSEERYRLIAENSSDVIWTMDMNLRNTYLSPSIVRLTGFSLEEAASIGIGDGLTPASLEAATQSYLEGMKALERNEAPPGGATRVELEMYRRDGSTVWAEVETSFMRDSEGKVVGIMGVARNIDERRRAEQALRESEDRFRLLFERSAEAQLLLDHEGKVVDCNDAMLRLFALSDRKQVVGHDPEEFAPEFQPDGTPSSDMGTAILAAVLEKGSAQLEWAHLKHDPQRTPIMNELICTLIPIQGQPFLHVAIRDITERKRAQEALQASEERNRLLIDNAAEVVTVVQDGLVKFINRKCMDFTGHLPEDLVSKSFLEIIHPDDQQMLADNYVQRLSGGQVPVTYQFRVIHKNGDTRWAEINIAQFDWEGKTAILALLSDITERKIAEEELQRAHAQLEARVEERTAELKEANMKLLQEIRQRRQAQGKLQESESKYRELVESASSIILELDTKGKVTFFNRFAQEFFGFSESDVVGRHVVGTMAPTVDSEGKDRKALTRDLVKHPEDYLVIENEGIRQSGERVWISWTNKGLYDAKGRLRNVLCIGMDRTEQKRVAEMLAGQVKEKAAADERQRLARDLHDAVTQTLFSASLIAEVLPRLWKKDRPEGERRLEELRRLTRGALAEMRMLLLELRPGALGEVGLAELLRQLGEATAGQTRILLTFTLRGRCSAPAEAQVALYRVAQEALNNVVKHSGATEAEISLHCREGSAEMTVSDNGSGFDPERVSPKSLGLRIMQERAEAVGATLKIEGGLGHGTKVTALWSTRRRKGAK